MIVRNEAHVIGTTLAMLVAKVPGLTHWVISDTGSDDGTPDLIRDFWAKHADKTGVLRHDVWQDFGTNRSIVMAAARATGAAAILMWDADDSITGTVEWPDCGSAATAAPPLASQYSVRFGDPSAGASVHWRPQLFSTAFPWRYEGVLHEYATCDGANGGAASVPLQGNYVCTGATTGSRNFDPNKYAKDAATLEAALAKDPTNPRHIFYCGNSYRDAGNHAAAAEKYKALLALGARAWVQERYMACMNLANIETAANNHAAATGHWLTAVGLIPERPEAVARLVQQACQAANHTLAVRYAAWGDGYTAADDVAARHLFATAAARTFTLPYYASISAIHVGRKDMARAAFRALFAAGYVPGTAGFQVRAIFLNLRLAGFEGEHAATPAEVAAMRAYRATALAAGHALDADGEANLETVAKAAEPEPAAALAPEPEPEPEPEPALAPEPAPVLAPALAPEPAADLPKVPELALVKEPALAPEPALPLIPEPALSPESTKMEPILLGKTTTLVEQVSALGFRAIRVMDVNESRWESHVAAWRTIRPGTTALILEGSCRFREGANAQELLADSPKSGESRVQVFVSDTSSMLTAYALPYSAARALLQAIDAAVGINTANAAETMRHFIAAGGLNLDCVPRCYVDLQPMDCTALCRAPDTLCVAETHRAQWFDEFTVLPAIHDCGALPHMAADARAAVKTLIVMQHPLVALQALEVLPSVNTVIVWNTEQVTRPDVVEGFKAQWERLGAGKPTRVKHVEVWDYSAFSAQTLGAALGIRVRVCSSASDADVATLRKLRADTPQTFDYACVGTPSPHRTEIVDAMRANGHSVLMLPPGSRGLARDREIAKAKCLLNIHFNEHYRVFESVRCCRWLAAGMAVLTEPCVNGDELGKPNLTIMGPVLPSKVVDAVNDGAITDAHPHPHPRLRSVAVILAYCDNGTETGHAQANLAYFLRHGLCAGVKVLLVANGGMCAASRAIAEASNIHIVDRPNTGYDFGAWAAGLKTLRKGPEPFPTHCIFLNSSVRGPFLPEYITAAAGNTSADLTWPTLFLAPLDKHNVKLVGPTINVFKQFNGAPPRPHVQSYAFGCDAATVAFLQDAGVFTDASDDKLQVIAEQEVRMSTLILQQPNWNIGCFVREYAGIDYRNADALRTFNPAADYHRGDVVVDDPPSLCFGRQVHPMELMFIKTNRGGFGNSIASLSKT
jgi:tetratricopeptide (TPR) repeat protein